jgi:peptide/nickel transport system permease protein
VLTFSGLTLAGLLNGSVVVEVVFAWPGIGRLMLQGIQTRDFPIVQATVLTAGALYIVTALPVLTFSGLTLAGLLNGSVVVEVVFAWPGIGRLMLQGIQTRDFPIVQATVLTAGALYIVTALMVDILYAYVNPRIRYE